MSYAYSKGEPWTDDIEKYPAKEYVFNFEGYICIAKRMPEWNWNGYIKLPSNHPYTGKNYDDVPVTVHEGLTYSKENIFGFDTYHLSCDLVPGDIVYYCRSPTFVVRNFEGQPTYKTLDFVKKELEKLASQFKKLEKKNDIYRKIG